MRISSACSSPISRNNRGNAARSRNTRLSAIQSFFKYVAVNEPQVLHHCQQVLAMPSKRHEKRTINYLTRDEIEALIEAADNTTRSRPPRPDPRAVASDRAACPELISWTA